MTNKPKDTKELREKLVETLLSEGVRVTMSVAKALDEFIDRDVATLILQERERWEGELLEEIIKMTDLYTITDIGEANQHKMYDDIPILDIKSFREWLKSRLGGEN